jgi:hypothetical protein
VTQPISSMVLCWPCQTPTPREYLARDAQGVPTEMCRWCAADQPVGDCQPEWAPVRRTINLQDIANYQEPQ